MIEVINDWWTHNEFPIDRLASRIVLIYKKGKTSDVLNYRPIALTSSLYKMFTSIIQKRMARAMDNVHMMPLEPNPQINYDKTKPARKKNSESVPQIALRKRAWHPKLLG